MAAPVDNTLVIRRAVDNVQRAKYWDGSLPPTGGEGIIISSVTGSFVNGGNLTINGSGFTAKRNGQLIHCDFQGGVVGSPIVEDNFASVAVGATYSDDAPLFGTKFWRETAIDSSPHGARIEFGAGYKEIFAEAWARVKIIAVSRPPGAHAPQIKMFRIVSSSSHGDHPHLATGPLWSGYDPNIYYRYNATWSNPTQIGDLGKDWKPTGAVWDSWIRWSMYEKLDEVSGKRYIKTSRGNLFGTLSSHLASPSGLIHPDTWDGDIQQTWNPAIHQNSHYTGFYLPFYTRSENQSTQIDVANIFINDSPERVSFGNAATWEACDPEKIITCKQVSRTTSQIQVGNILTGPLLEGPVYCYVWNSDNTVNNTGYLVRA